MPPSQPISEGVPVNGENNSERPTAAVETAKLQAKQRFQAMKAALSERRPGEAANDEPADPLRDFWGQE